MQKLPPTCKHFRSAQLSEESAFRFDFFFPFDVVSVELCVPQLNVI